MHEWQVWLVASLLLFVAEMLAPGFWLLSVAVGCLTAGVVSLVVPGAIVPALSFAAGTLLSLVGIRPFLLRYLHPRGTEIRDRKSTRLNSSHGYISYAVFCLKKKKNKNRYSAWTRHSG